MLINTSELTGAALDWAVASIEEADIGRGYYTDMVARGSYSPSTDWDLGGPIIEREQLQINAAHHNDSCAVEPMAPKYGFKAPVGWHWEAYVLSDMSLEDTHHCRGQTPLIAAMRCYVASKLGDEVEVPDELL